MNKYGYEVILCSKLDNKFIKAINLENYKNKKRKLAIQVKNTKYIDKESLQYLNKLKDKYDLDIKISVIGPYYTKENDNEVKKEKFFYNTLYDIEELYKIICNFEIIEKSIDPKWNKFDIVIYLAETLVRNIMYDPEYWLMKQKGLSIPKVVGEQDEADYHDRSLRGILTKKSVCAGYSVIFKELANRNGIECKYVSGASYSTDDIFLGGHAWNLIKIDGVIYPMDITRKNTKYRNGDFTNIEDISCDIEVFKKTHRPYDSQDNVGLTKLNEETVKRAKKKTIIRKHYNETTYTMERKDKTKFILSQIGRYKGLYRYLYTEINADGSYGIPTILFSESNLVKELNDHKFEKSKHYHKFIYSFINVLFSKENLLDSKRNKNTKYIGCCEIAGPNVHVRTPREIKKEPKKIATFKMDNIKSQKRKNGSILTLVQFPNNSNNGFAYEYYVYVLSKGPIVMEYTIYSNTDYFSIDSSLVVNTILSDESLHNSIENGGIIR